MRPRATMAELKERPAWGGAWGLLLGFWVLLGTAFLATPVGRQALVDERVRVIEAFGGAVSDPDYYAWQRDPPWWVYLTSGGRLLLTPVVTALAAGVLWGAARLEGVRVVFAACLAMAVHATAILVAGQLLATPLHYVRESLTSPFSLAAVLPLMEDGTLAARFFGTVDVFALWWGVVLAIGLSVLTGRRLTRYLWSLAGVFAAVAAGVAGAIAVMGGA